MKEAEFARTLQEALRSLLREEEKTFVSPFHDETFKPITLGTAVDITKKTGNHHHFLAVIEPFRICDVQKVFYKVKDRELWRIILSDNPYEESYRVFHFLSGEKRKTAAKQAQEAVYFTMRHCVFWHLVTRGIIWGEVPYKYEHHFRQNYREQTSGQKEHLEKAGGSDSYSDKTWQDYPTNE